MRRQWSPEYLRQQAITAYHEAGHVIGTLTEDMPVYEVRIWTVRAGWGHVKFRGHVKTVDAVEDDEVFSYVVGALAGPEAEAILIQQLDHCPLEHARQVAYEDNLDGDMDNVQDLIARLGGVDFTLDQAAEQARAAVTAHWSSVQLMAEALKERGRLTGRDLRRLLGTLRPARTG